MSLVRHWYRNCLLLSSKLLPSGSPPLAKLTAVWSTSTIRRSLSSWNLSWALTLQLSVVSRQYISVPDLWHRAPPPHFKVFQLRFYSTIPTSRSLLLVIFNRCLFFPLHRITKLRSLHSPTRPWLDLPVDAAPRAWPRQVEACWSYTNQPRWLDQNQGAPPLGLALDRLTPVPVSMRRDKQLVFTTIFQSTLVQLPVLDFTGAAVAAEARSPSINMPMTFPTAGRSN